MGGLRNGIQVRRAGNPGDHGRHDDPGRAAGTIALSRFGPSRSGRRRPAHQDRACRPRSSSSSGSLFMAAQYVHRRFLIPALAPVVYNLAIIGGGLLGAAIGEASPDAFIWGAFGGAGIGSFALQWWGAHRVGLRWIRTRTPILAEYLTLALPLMVGQSVAVLDEQFPRLFGQVVGPGAASSLSLARMLNMLAVGMIAQAAAVASFPFLARLVAGANEEKPIASRFARCARPWRLPCSRRLCFGPRAVPWSGSSYQWGAFDEAASEVVAGLVAIFALSIPAWGIHQVIARWFYAHRRMWLPVLIGTGATVLAIPVDVVAGDRWGAAGHRRRQHPINVAVHGCHGVAWFAKRAAVASLLVDALARGVVPAVAAASPEGGSRNNCRSTRSAWRC